MVLISGPELIDDFRKAPDDVLSTEPALEVRTVIIQIGELILTRISSLFN